MIDFKVLSDEEVEKLFEDVRKEQLEREASKREENYQNLKKMLTDSFKIMKKFGFHVQVSTDYDGYLETDYFRIDY